MKLFSNYIHQDNLHFIIEDVGYAGVYVYVYNNENLFIEDREKENECSGHIQDHHQDSIAMAKKYAHNHFSVPLESWVEAD